ncbi:hypothetical protein [Maribacter sp. ACAM166]|uniref:hypothetical protein n=1 Tax=Maribacter sp. ACAM166 TaxID=2508996 RepID=UPI0010FEC6C0|nr:hypothetical protein [Maribacter sp. ACAM166]TLP72927.1 hypothetical protein ES765_18345 [Maribacter sp. ACAM166]
MKYILLVLFTACLLSGSSCKEEKKVEEPSQMEEVMNIHDEVMPKMGTLGKLVGQLKPIADSLGAESIEAKAMKDLQDANKAMMDWMQGFGNRFDVEEIMKGKELSEEKKKWLKEEEDKVNKVKADINSSIEKAQEILNTQ